MGQAKRRGTFEERKALVLQREQERLDAIEAKRLLHYQQECAAYDAMVWWQIEMSEERHRLIMRAKLETNLQWAGLMGMIYGMGWDSFRGLMSR